MIVPLGTLSEGMKPVNREDAERLVGTGEKQNNNWMEMEK
jgi:hypothetical protein